MKSVLGLSALLLASAPVVRGGADTYDVNAICTSDQMMRYYQTKWEGLFGGSWWESGILMAALAELKMLKPDYPYDGTFNTTYNLAPNLYNYKNFINEYYDDQGWWGNGWVTAYDYAGKQEYLDTAINIFHNMSQGMTSCGGITQTVGGTYIATIANELYIFLGANLANRVSDDDKSTYLDPAVSVWNWVFSAGIVNDDNLIQDGLTNDSTCTPYGGKYSYNQGVILSGAAQLYKATGDTAYLEKAAAIANATTAKGSQFTGDNGVITDCATSSCDDQSAMFKGPLFRGIRDLWEVYPHSNWAEWAATNAISLWNNALNATGGQCRTGGNFNGPYGAGATVDEVTQGAALCALLAAWTMNP